MLFSRELSLDGAGRPAIVDGHRSVSYDEFNRAVAGFASHLRALGVTKGERVALWGYNSANWLVAFFAIVRAGGVALLVNYSMGVEEAAALLRDARARFVVCGDNGQTKRSEDALTRLADACGIALERCVDARAAVSDLVGAYADADPLPEQRAESEAGDTAFVIFTSGTTSRPKAVCVSQRALTADAVALASGLEGTLGGSACVAVPLFHILGLLTSYVYLMNGATVCLPQSYRPEALCAMIGAHGVSDMAAVGAVYQGLADAEGFAERVVPHVRTCLIAGGMSTPVQMMRLELAFANATFVNMYGQSEGAPLTMVRPSDLVELRASTVGRAVEGVELRIAGPDATPLPQGEVGEVLARGVCLMNGYEGLPAESQAVDSLGWLHTGDLGFLDGAGYLHLAGRLKDVIIRGARTSPPRRWRASSPPSRACATPRSWAPRTPYSARASRPASPWTPGRRSTPTPSSRSSAAGSRATRCPRTSSPTRASRSTSTARSTSAHCTRA